MDCLLVEINKQRESMITVANKTGIESEQTIKCSQHLDQLIYEYQKRQVKEKRQKTSYYLR
ncbi:hypothetical protein BC6307_09160 [Sutcliffiella cohnii]|uniref:Aspartyl-phosphate phosphatase Spo0E family protein n=2 Tax=Bacillaceae TaxID=186817 RepID=A0A223KXY7_9BACI|nr:hypothetical protein BC6307_09160 [Sutcliffiella cohnii]